MGRPGLGVAHVDALAGSPEEKERLRPILSTLTAERPVAEACTRLAISESRFAELRTAALTGALAALAPKAPGRPRKETPADPDEVGALRRQLREARLDRAIACVKAEVALTMPHLLVRETEAAPKKRAPHPIRRPAGTSSGGTSDASPGSSPP